MLIENARTVLSVKDLKTYFKTDAGIVKAVDGVSFDLHEEETLGIVGESGSGKSVTNLSIMRLIPSPPGKIAGGQVIFDGQDILQLPEKELLNIRGNKVSMIFQDPMTSLNPFLRISTQMIETIRLHEKGVSKKEALQRSIDMLKQVGIPAAESSIFCYPHQFSGGMRRRSTHPSSSSPTTWVSWRACATASASCTPAASSRRRRPTICSRTRSTPIPRA